MKKLTNFIIDKRYYLLGLFIILALLSLIISHNVKINYDMTKYLDNSSETKIGLDIMESNFPSKTSTLQIIVKNITNIEKENKYLENLENVKEVKSEQNGDYTSFTLTINGLEDSKVSKDIYNTVTNHFKNMEYNTFGNVSNQNKEILPLYVVVIAVISALIILIIASPSYTEPFLFLFCILISVAINKGTNIFLPSISNITESISAILQMALSMDYSIMLMNRYMEEKENEKDKVKAMKKALYNAFKSISSSSITTIVGLLALIFMEFKIGRDLGIVLAKGVLLSLLSIFTTLPALILLFDKLITKTKKKSPNIKVPLLSKISFKYRYLITGIFVIIFIFSFSLKGNLTYTYTESASDTTENLFNKDNTMAIIYQKQDEEVFSEYCQNLENNSSIKDVLCYGNTLNLPLTSEKLPLKLKDLDNEIEIEDYLLKIIYYHYYNNKEDNLITLNNIIKFIKEYVYDNSNLSKNIDEDMKYNIDRLENFANASNINKKREVKELANILNMNEDTVKNILIYYNSFNNNTEISLKSFINFIEEYISKNDEFKDKIDFSNIQKLKILINDPSLDYKIMATILDSNEEIIQKLYTYYGILNDLNIKISLNELNNFLQNNKSLIPNNDLLTILNTFTNKEFILKELSKVEIQKIFNIDINIVNSIFAISNKELLSPYDFILTIISNNLINSEEINLIYFIMDSTINEKLYNYQDLASILNMDPSILKSIYASYNSSIIKIKISEFIKFIIENQNNSVLNNNFDQKTINNLINISTIIENNSHDYKYSYQQLANILNLNEDDIKLIYSMYDIIINKKDLKLSFNEFINFLNDKVMNNDKYKDNFTKEIKSNLKIVLEIMNNSLNNKLYDKNELYLLLSPLTNDLDKDLIDLLYIYYGSVYDYKEYYLTIEEFSSYLNNVILKDKRFDDYITEKEKNDIISSKDKIKDAKEELIGKDYNRIVLNTSFKEEGEETYNFIKNINNDLNKLSKNSYLVGDSTMAYEMNNNFGSELNLITILTIIFILVVVLITFKSFIIPIILVLIIQTSVFLIMGILSFSNEPLYFISILIVQSILMGATIDYAILYTSYYLEERTKNNIKDAIFNAYNKSLHTILVSASILTIVTLIVGLFSSQVASKICTTLSKGTITSSILIIFLLPSLLATFDKLIVKHPKC